MMAFVFDDAMVSLVELGVYLWYICAYIHEVKGVSNECLCVCWKGWLCLKVMLTVHTKTAPEESTSVC